MMSALAVTVAHILTVTLPLAHWASSWPGHIPIIDPPRH